MAESKGQLYNDDGLTAEAYQNGQYELLTFTSKVNKSKISIQLSAEIGSDFPMHTKSVDLVLHNINVAPKWIKIGRKKSDFIFNKEEKSITVPMVWSAPKELKLNIKLNKHHEKNHLDSPQFNADYGL